MSLTAAINTAFSGLQATQAGLDVVSQNVANSGTVGYTRRVLDTEQLVGGGRTFGVDIKGASRTLDTIVQRQLRLEQAGAAYASAKADAHGALDKLFDTIGGEASVSSLVDTVAAKLQSLASNPSSYVAQSQVLSAASDLAGTLNGLAGDVQSLRQNAENAIFQDVTRADGLLGQIATLNGKIVASPTAALQDQRDALIDQLSRLIDVKVNIGPSGSATLSTTGGLALVDGTGATRLSFDAHTVGAEAAYDPDPTKRTVGTITATDATGARRDVLASGLIRSGDIAAQIELRDKIYPKAQAQLDQLAAGLAGSLSDAPLAGTAVGSGASAGFDLDLASLSAGNAVTVTVDDGGGATRTLTFVKVTSATGAATAAAAGAVAIDVSAGYGSVASQIGAKLGASYATSNPSGATIRVTGSASGTVKSLTANATRAGLATGAPELALFVDGGRNGAAYTGSFESGSQLAGFAARIAVNGNVVANRGVLSAYGPSIPSGDPTRPQLLHDRITSTTRAFSGAAGIGGSAAPWTGTVAGFAQGLISTQAADASSAATLDAGQKVVLNAVQARFSDSAGVNIDTELTQLIQLQTAYGANARVLSAANDLFQLLFRIGG